MLVYNIDMSEASEGLPNLINIKGITAPVPKKDSDPDWPSNSKSRLDETKRAIKQVRRVTQRLLEDREEANPPEKKPLYDEVKQRTKQDLTDFYSDLGITINRENLPEMYIFPKGKYGYREGLCSSKGDYLRVFDPGDPEQLAEGAAHELFHGSGYKALRVLIEQGEARISQAQIGYLTTPKSPHGVRGKTIEEGLAVVYSRPYLKGKESCMTNKAYAEAAKLVDLLIADGGGEMEKLLYIARINNRERSKLLRMIDNVYGSGTAKEIFHLQFREHIIRQFREKIERSKSL